MLIYDFYSKLVKKASPLFTYEADVKKNIAYEAGNPQLRLQPLIANRG
jgi:hypothetical protein